LALLGVVVSASPALAQPMDTYGMGSRSVALAGAVTADVEDFSANYYNPAGIVRSGEMRVGIGWFGVDHELSMNGLDSNVDPAHGIVVGLNVPGHIDDFRFAFGLGVHLNDQRISRSRSLPRQRPRWEFYDNRPQRTFLAAHVAIQPWDWLRIGGGIGFLSYTTNELTIRGSIDITNPERGSRLEHSLDGELFTIRFPQVGVQVQPIEELNFGIVYRGEYALSNDLIAVVGSRDPTSPDAVTIEAGPLTIPGYLNLLTASTNAYAPHQLSFGVSANPIPELRLSAELTWLLWHLYQSPIGTTNVELEITVPPELMGMIMVPDSITPGMPVDPFFQDRVVPRFGVEWMALHDENVEVDIRAGYFYENTPVPEQRGYTNLVDTDRHAFSLGAGLELFQLRPLLPGSLAFDVHLQYSFLPERAMRKVLTTDAIGDYVASGHIFAGGVTMEARFE
ncbi:MAG: OmpP1/FadL family transporter, partial [Sandaracinaceae bacterium]